jgi:hypothetical protein
VELAEQQPKQEQLEKQQEQQQQEKEQELSSSVAEGVKAAATLQHSSLSVPECW